MPRDIYEIFTGHLITQLHCPDTGKTIYRAGNLEMNVVKLLSSTAAGFLPGGLCTPVCSTINTKELTAFPPTMTICCGRRCFSTIPKGGDMNQTLTVKIKALLLSVYKKAQMKYSMCKTPPKGETDIYLNCSFVVN